MQLLLLWHFHQPYYGYPDATGFELPWVRLHATKSYVDMAAVLERYPTVKATANFSGSLLEQIARYVDDGWRDRFWDLTLRRPDELSEEEYHFVLRHFFSLDWQRVMPRFPRYVELLEKRGHHELDKGQERFTDAELVDLQVLFNLAWCGFTLRSTDERVKALVDKGRDYTHSDKQALLDAHIEALASVLPRWRALVERGQIEPCVTPQYHPILPLLIDSDSARRAMPNNPMPARFRNPADAEAHIRLGLETAERAFGARPAGIWPSEGSVSPELLPLVAQSGLRWLATDEHVLLASGREGSLDRRGIYEPWWLVGKELAGFFRDHEISDLVGFSYQRTEADRAVADFCGRLMLHGVEGDGKVAPPCVSVILDGENAWEHYPDDGRAFLETLHKRLASIPDIETVTPSQRLAEHPPTRRVLHIHSGSWISANFRIWIGTPTKNEAWTQLQQTRRFFEERSAELSGQPSPPGADPVERARTALLRAEGSDWFWWYGDDFSSDNDALFDELFRRNLSAVYEALGHASPLSLEQPIDGHDLRPAMVPPRSLISPRIDGEMAPYLDWVDAGRYVPTGAAGSMAQTSRYVDELRFGFDLEQLFLRLQTNERVWPSVDRPFAVRLELSTPDLALRRTFFIPIDGRGQLHPRAGSLNGSTESARGVCHAHYRRCLEVAVPFAALGLNPGDEVEFALQLERAGVRLQRVPQMGSLDIVVPDDTFDGRHWYV